MKINKTEHISSNYLNCLLRYEIGLEEQAIYY